MKIKLLSSALEDLYDGRLFYEKLGEGLGEYFYNSLFSDIDSLTLHAGIHPKFFGYYRMLSKRFPGAAGELTVGRQKEGFAFDKAPFWFHNGFRLKSFGGVNMATVTVKNIPDELYERLKSAAEINRRSINSEIIMCIENTVISRRINLDEVLENARQLRRLTAGHPITHEEFNQAKSEGRL